MLRRMLTLLAVVLGGVLTLAGQVIIDIRSRRMYVRERQEKVRSVCRLQQDLLWAYQDAVRQALSIGEWRPEFLHPMWQPSVDDYRFIAETVPSGIWGPYSRALRGLSQMLYRDAGNLQFLLETYLCAEISRQRLHAFSGRDSAFLHDLGRIKLTRSEIESVLSSDYFRGNSYADIDEVQVVMANVIARDE